MEYGKKSQDPLQIRRSDHLDLQTLRYHVLMGYHHRLWQARGSRAEAQECTDIFVTLPFRNLETAHLTALPIGCSNLDQLLQCGEALPLALDQEYSVL